jgi:hypothetical protein
LLYSIINQKGRGRRRKREKGGKKREEKGKTKKLGIIV